MGAIFWTGELSPMMKFVASFRNGIAWVTGNARDAAAIEDQLTQQPNL